MQDIEFGFVTWSGGGAEPILFAIIHIGDGVGAVVEAEFTNGRAIRKNTRALRKQGHEIVKSVSDGVIVTTYLPKGWDRDAAIVATDAFAEMFIANMTHKGMRGFHAN